jgi:hypothetical protein
MPYNGGAKKKKTKTVKRPYRIRKDKVGYYITVDGEKEYLSDLDVSVKQLLLKHLENVNGYKTLGITKEEVPRVRAILARPVNRQAPSLQREEEQKGLRGVQYQGVSRPPSVQDTQSDERRYKEQDSHYKDMYRRLQEEKKSEMDSFKKVLKAEYDMAVRQKKHDDQMKDFEKVKKEKEVELAKIKQEGGDATRAYKEKEAELNKIQAELDKRNKEGRRMEREQQEIDADREEHEKTVENLNKRIELLESNLAETEAASKLEASKREVEKKEWKTYITNLKNEYEESKARSEALEKKENNLTAEINNWKKAYADYEIEAGDKIRKAREEEQGKIAIEKKNLEKEADDWKTQYDRDTENKIMEEAKKIADDVYMKWADDYDREAIVKIQKIIKDDEDKMKKYKTDLNKVYMDKLDEYKRENSQKMSESEKQELRGFYEGLLADKLKEQQEEINKERDKIEKERDATWSTYLDQQIAKTKEAEKDGYYWSEQYEHEKEKYEFSHNELLNLKFASGELEKERDTLRRELADAVANARVKPEPQVNAEIDRLKIELVKKNEDIKKMRTRIEELEGTVGELALAEGEARKDLAEKIKELEQIKKERIQADKERETLENELVYGISNGHRDSISTFSSLDSDERKIDPETEKFVAEQQKSLDANRKVSTKRKLSGDPDHEHKRRKSDKVSPINFGEIPVEAGDIIVKPKDIKPDHRDHKATIVSKELEKKRENVTTNIRKDMQKERVDAWRRALLSASDRAVEDETNMDLEGTKPVEPIMSDFSNRIVAHIKSFSDGKDLIWKKTGPSQEHGTEQTFDRDVPYDTSGTRYYNLIQFAEEVDKRKELSDVDKINMFNTELQKRRYDQLAESGIREAEMSFSPDWNSLDAMPVRKGDEIVFEELPLVDYTANDILKDGGGRKRQRKPSIRDLLQGIQQSLAPKPDNVDWYAKAKSSVYTPSTVAMTDTSGRPINNDSTANSKPATVLTMGGGKRWGTTDNELHNVMHKVIKKHIPVIMADQIRDLKPLVNKKTKQFGFIINNEPKNRPGRHWRACFIDIPKGDIYYFDSLVSDPSNRFMEGMEDLIEKIDPDIYLKLKTNTVKLQDDTSDTCGWFCVKFLEDMYSGGSFHKFMPTIDESTAGEKQIEKYKDKHVAWI